MREILFRGKRVDNDEWVEGSLVIYTSDWHCEEKTFCDIAHSKKGKFNRFEIATETIGQYTGLTDKDGKKIFEGDIVEFWQDESYVNRGIIEYKDCWFEIKPIGESAYCLIATAVKWHNAEIIGNIHDNPEPGRHNG